MSDNSSKESYVDESKLTDLERSILFDFQLLSEEEQKTVLESIASLLGKYPFILTRRLLVAGFLPIIL